MCSYWLIYGHGASAKSKCHLVSDNNIIKQLPPAPPLTRGNILTWGSSSGLITLQVIKLQKSWENMYSVLFSLDS